MALHDYECIDENEAAEIPEHFERWAVPGGWLYERQTKAGVTLAFVPDHQAAHTKILPSPRTPRETQT